MRFKLSLIFYILVATVAFVWFGCSTAPEGPEPTNKAPETYIANVPPVGDTIPAVTLVYWYGVDDDGFIAYYEWAHSADSVDPSQITDWDSIGATDDTMALTVDDVDPSIIVIDTLIDTTVVGADTFVDSTFTYFFTGYFYVRAYDNEGAVDPTPAWRGWNVYSVKPRIEITAPDASSGMVSYYLATDPIFFPKGDTPTVFILDDTTALWKGVEVWWNRADTMNEEGNDPIGYRFRIDNGNWSTWTDEDPATAGDSYIYFTGPIADGMHTFHLQGRNASHIESRIDSMCFYAVNPNIDDGKIIIALASGLTYNLNRFWYDTLMTMVRPNADYEVLNREFTQPMFSHQDLQGVSLIIYVKDDMTTSDPGIKKDSLILWNYTNVGGKVWIFGMKMLNVLEPTMIGTQLIEDRFGLEFFDISNTKTLRGVYPSWQAPGYNLPSDTLMVDEDHAFPSDTMLSLCENYRSSDPNVDVLYHWYGTAPWNETPVGVTHLDTERDIQIALFGFSGYCMHWDSLNYEPIATIYDEMLTWFGL